MQDLTELITKTIPLIAGDDFEPMAEKAKAFLKSSKTIESVIFTAKTQMGFLHDEYLSDSLSVHSDGNIDFRTLKQCEHQNVTVFLIVPIQQQKELKQSEPAIDDELKQRFGRIHPDLKDGKNITPELRSQLLKALEYSKQAEKDLELSREQERDR